MMPSMSRLDAMSPHVAERFRNATPEKRLRATILACEAAISMVGLAAGEGLEVALVREAIEKLRQGGVGSKSLRVRLDEMVGKFDERYFRAIDDSAGEVEVLKFFSRARAVSALAFALAGDSALREALYEALCAANERAEVLGAVVDAL